MNVEDKQSLLVRCPICRKQQKLEIPMKPVRDAINLASISIPSGRMCEHNFQAFVDKNFQIRGYQKVDFELPRDIDEKRLDDHLLLESDLTTVESIKWNLSPLHLAHVLRGIILDRNIVFCIPDSRQELVGQLSRFIELIFHDTFKTNITIIAEHNYKELKKDFKSNIVVKWGEILGDKARIMDSEKMKVESKIAENFYETSSKQEALVDLEYEIRKIFSLSNRIIMHIKELQENEKVNLITLKEHLERVYSLETEIQYLEYIIEVIRHYFKFKVPIEDISKMRDFLRLI